MCFRPKQLKTVSHTRPNDPSRGSYHTGYVRKDATYLFTNEVTSGRVQDLRVAGDVETVEDGAVGPLYAIVNCHPAGRRALTADLSPAGEVKFTQLLPPADWDRLRRAAYKASTIRRAWLPLC